MSLCFLVEGDRTEKRMYRAWVGHVFPSLTQVLTIGEITSSSYCVISGGGIPLYKEELRDALSDIRQNAEVRHLFLCIDAEELSREDRRREMEDEIRKAEIESQVRTGNPWLAIHPIVQKRPDAVLGADYLQALRHRCVATGHLASLQELFDTWESIAPHAAPP